jgi:hypothetical protein
MLLYYFRLFLRPARDLASMEMEMTRDVSLLSQEKGLFKGAE